MTALLPTPATSQAAQAPAAAPRPDTLVPSSGWFATPALPIVALALVDFREVRLHLRAAGRPATATPVAPPRDLLEDLRRLLQDVPGYTAYMYAERALFGAQQRRQAAADAVASLPATATADERQLAQARVVVEERAIAAAQADLDKLRLQITSFDLPQLAGRVMHAAVPAALRESPAEIVARLLAIPEVGALLDLLVVSSSTPIHARQTLSDEERRRLVRRAAEELSSWAWSDDLPHMREHAAATMPAAK